MKVLPLMLLIFYTSFFIIFTLRNSEASIIDTVGNVLKSGKDITTGIISNLPSSLPGPESLLQLSKNVLVGYPFELLFDAINKICTEAVSSNAIKPKYTPDVYKMSFVLMTPTKNYSFPLTDAEEMWKCAAFDKNKPTVLLTTGWTTDLNDTNGCIYTLSNAYFCRGNVNFVVVNTAGYVDTLYTWSAFNTEELGIYIGKAIRLFTKYCDYRKMHLIGHSLGAHICGAAGRTFKKETGLLLPRITGLDPANPCYNGGDSLYRLQRGDAEFVDVIHTNPGALGIESSIGDVDFHPGGSNPLPKGCVSITCSHARAWVYYGESVIPGNEYNFMAKKCTSYSSYKSGRCDSDEVPMGYATPSNVKGDYYLGVHSESPFGENSTQNSNNYYTPICYGI